VGLTDFQGKFQESLPVLFKKKIQCKIQRNLPISKKEIIIRPEHIKIHFYDLNIFSLFL
jgi:hypothetical protein